MNLEELKKNGEAPEFMNNEGYQTLINGYLLKNETPKQMYVRLAKAAASYYDNSEEWEKKFFDVMWKNWLCPASPVLSNFGTVNRGLPISCFSIHVNDSVSSIFTKNHELAMLSKNGGGVGIYFGDIRGRGATITNNGKSEGIVPWAKVFDTTTAAISQGCYDDKTEILTENGWEFFENLKQGTLVAQSSGKGEISFVPFTDYIKYHVNEDLINFSNDVKSIDLLVTKNHRMAVEYRKRISNKRNAAGKFLSNEKKSEGYLRIIEADKLSPHRDNCFWVTAHSKQGVKESLTPLDKFYIAYQADGTTNLSGSSNVANSGTLIYNFHFSKQRKIDRLKNIINDLNWHFTELSQKDETTVISVRVPLTVPLSKKFIDLYNIKDFSQSFSEQFIEEIGCWDGSFSDNNSISYTSTIKENVDFIQSVSFLAGKYSRIYTPVKNKDYHQLKHRIYITSDTRHVGGETIKKNVKYYNGYVYCVTVPSGLLVVRRNGVLSICGNSTRRGASAIYLDIDHSDIEEFINIRRPTGDVNRRCLNINQGVCITDSWMQAMLDGDTKKRKIWEEILTERVETGEPYLFFTDNVNNKSPECYKKNNLTVKTSNICCLAGDTLVATKNGAARIDSLVDKEVEIFDGKNWVKTNSFKLQGEDELIRIYTSDGSYTDSNANHRWFIYNNADSNIVPNKSWETFTKNLKVGQRIECDTNTKEAFRIITITKIEKLEGKHKVYCPTIPSTGKFALANGLMTGNSEITLYTDPEHTFVCCLSSLNLVRYDEWKNTDLVNIAVRFLDAVLSEFIKKTENIEGMQCARRSAIKGRALGIGVIGFHALLQNKNLPMDCYETMQLNAEIFRTIKEKAEQESKLMAEQFGEPEWCQGFNRRHTHLIALAPTVSNSIISNIASASIEPIAANIYSQKSAKGTFIRKNPALEKLLQEKNKNTPEIWSSINSQDGSVQHLDFLSDHEKEVFLTAREINQHALVKLAVQRQKWVDQGQSLNLFFAGNSDPKYIHQVHIEAWKAGLKTLYYLRSAGIIKGDQAFRSSNECKACEG